MANCRFDFSGKNVVITGGASGIGFETAKQFLHAGATVHVWDFSKEAIAAAEAELSSFATTVHFSCVNVREWDSCASAARELGGHLDILVNNAGITRDKSFKKMDSETFASVIETNLTGVFNVTKALLPEFSDSSTNRIISIASVVALYGNFGQTNYVAAKSGVIGMTKTWARELGAKGFTANAIAPGFIETAMVKAMPDVVVEQMTQKIPAGRLGHTRDIAHTIQFLASEEAAYINGAVISVDGGMVC